MIQGDVTSLSLATQSVLDALAGPTLIVNAEGVVTAVNEAWRRFCDESQAAQADGSTGQPYGDLCGPLQKLSEEKRDACRRGVRAVLSGGLPGFRLDYQCETASGVRAYMMSVTPLTGEAGGALITHLDVTESRAAEAKFERLLEAPIDALMVVDERGRIAMVNAQMALMFGYTRDELLGRRMDFLIPERFRRRHEQHHEHYFADPHARPMGTGLELLALRRDGSEFPVEISLTPLETDGQTLISAAIRDVSERVEAERALRESESRVALHVEHTPLAVIEWDVRSRLLTAWNPAAERIFGYRADEVVGQRTADLLISGEVEEPPGGMGYEHLEAGGARSSQRNVTKDGRIVICEWYVTPLEDASGNVVRVAALALDVTARQRALESLLTAQEEERGRISRDLHDQVGQSLTAMLLGINALGRHPDEERLEHLKTLTGKTLEDVRRISRNLRPALLDELGLEAALKRFARELAAQSGVDIDVLARLPERSPRNVELVIYRVVQEALTNVVRHAEAEHASVIVTAGGGRVHLIVEDDGVGFDVASLSKAEHVGLAGMRERLELLGGSLRIESSPERGTAISARVPLRA